MAGQNPAMIVRVEADLAKLKEQLATGEFSIETTTKKMVAFANSYSGERTVQQAHDVMAAIEAVGGVTQLTAKEQAQANRVLDEAIEKYKSMGREAPAAMVELEQATSKVPPVTRTATDRIKEMAAGYVAGMLTFEAFKAAGMKVIEFFKESIQAAAEAEAAQKRLTIAMENQGSASPALIKQYDELAKATQRVSTFSDTAVKELQVMLVQVGNVLPTQMGLAVKATTDLASAMGIDLAQAGTIMAKAAEGNTAALGKMGIQLDEARVKGEGLEYIAGQIEKRFGGQAQAEIATYAGQIKQLGNEWDSTKEAVGRFVIETGVLQGTMQSATMQSDFYTAVLTGNTKALALMLAQLGHATTGLDIYKRIIDESNQSLEEQERRIKASGSQYASAAQHADNLVRARREEEIATRAVAEADRLAANAKERHNSAVQALVDQWSGARLAERVQLYADAIERMGGISKITAFELSGLSKDLAEFWKQGAALDPVMKNLVLSQMDFNAAIDTTGSSLRRLLQHTNVYKETLVTVPPVMTDLVLKSGTLEKANDDVADSADRATGSLKAMVQTMTLANLTQQQQRANYEQNIESERINSARGHFLGQSTSLQPDDPRKWIMDNFNFERRAMGGPVNAKQPYIVGERGPEMFVPQSSGTIVPNGAGGGITIHVTNNVQGSMLGTREELARLTNDNIMTSLRNAGVV